MYNFEKYFDNLSKEIELSFALIDGKISPCYELNCNVCDFCEPEIDCEVLKKKWLMEESKPEHKYYVICMTDGTIEGVYYDTDKPLNSMESLEELKDKLRDFTGFKNVCILNWRELEV